MTPEEAAHRISVSHRTLAKLVSDRARTKPADIMCLITEEISILEALAEDHPGKADYIMDLVVAWTAYRQRTKAKGN